MTQEKPRGGTELQLEYLYKHVDNKLLNRVQITTSVPEKIALAKGKPNILWQKNSWDQPNIYPWFNKKENHKKYDWYVFNSHWNYENFVKMFDLPTEKCLVIKNGIKDIPAREISYSKDETLKIIHHCTPWRGLNVLLGAMQKVTNPNIELDVYSSTEVYGKAFHEANDLTYQGLYEQAKQLKNVNYIGYKPNEYIKENLHKYDLFVYPSIWEETFCISLLEAMAAGLYCVTTNFGALYETGGEFPMYIPYSNNYQNLSIRFAAGIDVAAKSLEAPGIKDHLKMQMDYVNRFYDWNIKAISWTRFLQGVLNEKNMGK